MRAGSSVFGIGYDLTSKHINLDSTKPKMQAGKRVRIERSPSRGLREGPKEERVITELIPEISRSRFGQSTRLKASGSTTTISAEEVNVRRLNSRSRKQKAWTADKLNCFGVRSKCLVMDLGSMPLKGIAEIAGDVNSTAINVRNKGFLSRRFSCKVQAARAVKHNSKAIGESDSTSFRVEFATPVSRADTRVGGDTHYIKEWSSPRWSQRRPLQIAGVYERTELRVDAMIVLVIHAAWLATCKRTVHIRTSVFM